MQWLKRIDTPTAGVRRDVIGITPDNPNYVVVGTAPNEGNQLHHHQHPIQPQQFESATVKQRDGVYLSKLRIRRVTDVEAGHYVCFTMNHAGYTYREVNLTVWKGQCNVQCCLLALARQQGQGHGYVHDLQSYLASLRPRPSTKQLSTSTSIILKNCNYPPQCHIRA